MLLLRSHHLLLPHAARLLARRAAAAPLPRTAAAARLRPLRMSASNHSGAGASSPSAPSPPPAPAMPKSRIPFCPACGSPTKLAVPDGDEKMRAVCSSCGRVHYENPKMVVGCLVEHDNKVLLCRRKIEPAYGLWTLPAGYLEVGESAAAGASRETLEEACADVEIVSPFAQLDIPLIGQSYIIFRARMKTPSFSPGSESLECALFALDDIPFDSLAFSSIIVTLRMYIEDVKAGNIKFHYCTINKRIGAGPSDLRSFDIDNHLAV
ncbi:Nudix hydrolase 23, chloroplastic [Hordeum vulgare]|uniref:Nudix hydrolase domain-containing protein n=1 Tax=Hordeum vulgare subsp. vulgare TaxID=112509 RepID=A0A8I6Y5P5_HORVV|nr:nudix hydrolase 23, chloroplastic [Hordeum vulgare subsp. vulgare]KAE8781976.1 Nudix hydrolase 23, chloroplastic [Hordeum vulgare]KAI4984427.1 hypothetical protein ZWY2020_017057 [Hordeum vulgare]